MPATVFSTPNIPTSGEYAVSGTGWKQLTATSSKCLRIRFEAPQTGHPKNAANTSTVFIKVSLLVPSDTSGAHLLKTDGSTDYFENGVSDPSNIWMYFGTTADAVEYQIVA